MSNSSEFPVYSITRESGLCWSANLPLDVPAGDDVGAPIKSTLRLYEDGMELGPPHAVHDQIRRQGGGRFSHWNRGLYFSTSDGSDPLVNGRRYTFRVDAEVRIGDQEIDEAAQYAITQAENCIRILEAEGIKLDGTTILEIGPGSNLGTQMLLAGCGVDMVVADRFLAQWQPFHLAIYQRILEAWGKPCAPLEKAVAQKSLEGCLRMLPHPAENLEELDDDSVDVVISNAVLEHVYDPRAVAKELARVSRPGALHHHQVDYRDHNDFERPLDHLLIPPAQFASILAACQNERGCQTRHREMEFFFRDNGYEIVRSMPFIRPEPDYMDDFMVRLGRSESSYRDWPADDLGVLAGLLLMRAPA